MSEETRPKIENLELNKESLAELSEEDAERAEGGGILLSLPPCDQSGYRSLCIQCFKLQGG